MSSDIDRSKPKENANFWRALKFLGPYRGMVAVSVVCALLVGLVFTGGLGAMLPIFKVLLEDQTVAQWMDRQIVEYRLGAKLAERTDTVAVGKVSPDGVAAQMDLKSGDAISGGLASASPAVTQLEGHPLPPIPWHLQIGRNIAQRFP